MVKSIPFVHIEDQEFKFPTLNKEDMVTACMPAAAVMSGVETEESLGLASCQTELQAQLRSPVREIRQRRIKWGIQVLL